MNREKKRKRILTDNSKCEVISSAISDLVTMSDNIDFIQRCHQILQTQDNSQVKSKVNRIFSNAMIKKKNSKESMSSKIEEPDSVDTLFDDLDHSCADLMKELEGFEVWSDNENNEVPNT